MEESNQMKVKELMTTEVISVDKDQDLKYVMDLMRKHEISKIPVLEAKKLVGIITDNKISMKLGSIRKKGVPASRLHASSVTEKDIKSVSSDTPIANVLRMVGEPGPTILPIVDNDRLVGVLTKADLLPLVAGNTPLRDIMISPVVTVSPEDRVIHARRIMLDNDIARLPVVDHGSLVGIVSDVEIAFALAEIKRISLGKQKRHLEELYVADVMKTPVVWTTGSVKVSDAATLMLKHNIGALPIIESNTIVGIVTRTDLIRTVNL
jgi:CBS domain-containing protein